MASILDPRDLTDDERAAIADVERPGVWIEALPDGGYPAGDGRRLTQEQTDELVYLELFHRMATPDDEATLTELHGPWTVGSVRLPAVVSPDEIGPERLFEGATQQRGGIHSEPLVRLLAFRIWGDRDRTWRKRDTAEAIRERLVYDRREIDESSLPVLQRVYGFDGIAITEERWKNQRTLTASRGHLQAEVVVLDVALRAAESFAQVIFDAFDELDQRLEAGGDPPSAGPSVQFGPR